jgi:hypothetical protein
MLAVNRSSRGLTRIENLSRRQSCICFTLPYIWIKSSPSDQKKPQIGAFLGSAVLGSIKAYLLQHFSCLEYLVYVADYLNATPFFGQFAVDIEKECAALNAANLFAIHVFHLHDAE